MTNSDLPNDRNTPVAALRDLVAEFVAEREWSVYHSPKNLAMSIAIESAELMEHFQWIESDASRAIAHDPAKLAEVGEELADVVGYCLALSSALGLDLSQTIRAKMAKNHAKYPAPLYRGKPSYEKPTAGDDV
ncbi:MAG: nucleotide pyrophosphohydrolase [Lacipirellulaceae bacterium]